MDEVIETRELAATVADELGGVEKMTLDIESVEVGIKKFGETSSLLIVNTPDIDGLVGFSLTTVPYEGVNVTNINAGTYVSWVLMTWEQRTSQSNFHV